MLDLRTEVVNISSATEVQVSALLSKIAHIQQRAARQFALNAETPRLFVGIGRVNAHNRTLCAVTHVVQ